MATQIMYGLGYFKISLNDKKTKFIIEISPKELLEVNQESTLRDIAVGVRLNFKCKDFETRKPLEEFKV